MPNCESTALTLRNYSITRSRKYAYWRESKPVTDEEWGDGYTVVGRTGNDEMMSRESVDALIAARKKETL